MTGAVVVMARAARPGACKTRLEPLLGPAGCAELQAALIRHALALASATPRSTVFAFDPPDATAELKRLVGADVLLVPQADGSLGERLAAAVAIAFNSFGGPVTVIGCDMPLLSPGHLAAVDAALASGCDACLVPASDGGYGLLALARPAPGAFALPPEAWGGPDVRSLTLAALRRLGLGIGLFDAIDDLDTPDDARRLARHPACPPAVRALIEPHLARAA
jgi:uncharacterized protein